MFNIPYFDGLLGWWNKMEGMVFLRDRVGLFFAHVYIDEACEVLCRLDRDVLVRGLADVGL